jgi:hypothetical protein
MVMEKIKEVTKYETGPEEFEWKRFKINLLSQKHRENSIKMILGNKENNP